MSLTDELKQHARDQGVDLLGCTSARPFVVGPDRRQFDPCQAMPAARAVVAAACYTYGYENPQPSRPGRPRGRFGPWTRASLAAAGHAQRVVTDFLRTRGFQADSPEDTPLKMVAVRSGIAQYGKNCIVHAAGFGSYLKFAAAVTDADLDCRDVPVETSDCADCTACQAACPTRALAEPFRLNRPRCVTAWLWGDPIPRDDRRHVGDYIFSCGRCQDACPKNRALAPRRDFPFPLEDKPDTPELIPLLLGDDAYLRATLPEFVLFAGPDAIRRNIAIALGNLRDPAAAPALAHALRLPHAETRAVAAWSLGRLGGPEAREALAAALQAEQEEAVRHEIADALAAARPQAPAPVIESAVVADAQEILDLQKLAYQSEAAIYNDYTIPPLTQSLDQMQADIRQQVVLKATLDGRIVGSVRGQLRNGTCHIGRLIVHPDLQNRGVGTALMHAIEGHFLKASRYELFTGERSQRNLHLYQKLGYRIFRTDRLTETTNLVFLEKNPTRGQAVCPEK